MVELMPPKVRRKSSICTSLLRPSRKEERRPASSSATSGRSRLMRSRKRSRLARVRLGGSASRMSPADAGSSCGSSAATGATEKSSYSTSHAIATSKRPSASRPSGCSQSSLLAVNEITPSPAARRSALAASNCAMPPSPSAGSNRGPCSVGSPTARTPHAMALSRLHCSASGSRSSKTTLSAPASAAAMPPSPSPAPTSTTVLPRTSSGRSSSSSAMQSAECQGRAQYGSRSSRPWSMYMSTT
mmetsp:Transcript_9710/g.24740  ORF Transcript_9710/g.24740 Transcript_9710/m.24740 type:complete len:244 (-) Transcript_9710:378-1109(-)